jgi:hypothetical protein
VRRSESGTSGRPGRQIKHSSSRELSDEELVGRAPGSPGPHYEMEMNSQLKAATENLTAEPVTFRESSDMAAPKLWRLTNVLIGFTAALVALTAGLVILTIILAAKG